MKVLIVEDSPLVRESGQSYDLILLDLRMPDMDGVDFIRAVRRQGVLGRILIVQSILHKPVG